MGLFFLIFAVIIILKITINIQCFIKLKYFQKKYEDYLVENNMQFIEYKQSIIKLFERANVTDSIVPTVSPAGYGQLFKANLPLFKNINVTRPDIIQLTRNAFYESIGVFRSRILESLSPLYWINFLIYLPKNCINFIGVKKQNSILNIIQVIYWITSIIIALLNIKGIDKIVYLKNWINNF